MKSPTSRRGEPPKTREHLRDRVEDLAVAARCHLQQADACLLLIFEEFREDARKYRPRTEAQKEAAPPQQEQAA